MKASAASDSRTHAGVDNYAKFCKMTVFDRDGDRVLVLLSSGGLAATQAVISAMQKANSTDPKRYAPALASISMQGVTGKIAFEPNGDLKDPPATLFEAQNGKWNVITVASGKP